MQLKVFAHGVKRLVVTSKVSTMKVLAFVNAVLYIGLVIVCVTVFFGDVIEKYSNRVKGYQIIEDKTEEIPAPDVTFCFEPSVKADVKKFYGLVESFIVFDPNVTKLNGSFEEIFHNLSYRLNEDFTISTPPSWETENSVILEEGLNTVKILENEVEIEIRKVPTLGLGLCYTLLSKANISQSNSLNLGIEIKNDDIISLEMFLNSNMDYPGIIFSQWFNLNPYKKKMKLEKLSKVEVTEIHRKFLEGNTDHFFKCFGNFIKDSLLQNRCLPYILDGYWQILANESKKCEKIIDEIESFSTVQQMGRLYQKANAKCGKLTQKIHYEAEVAELPFDLKNKAVIRISGAVSPKRTIKEYLIYNIGDVIGTLGGSLGLFVGFSFFGVLSECLKFISNKF